MDGAGAAARFYNPRGLVWDGKNESNVAVVSLDMSAQNQVPVAMNGSLPVFGASPASGQLAASDPGDGVLTYFISTAPARGAITLDSATGAFIYASTQNLAGSDAFTFTVWDGKVESNIATITLDIAYLNALPVIISAPIAVPSPAFTGESVSFFVAALDPEGSALAIVWNFKDGSFGTGSHPQHVFTTAGTYAVEVTIDDGALSATAAVSIDVVASRELQTRQGSVKLNFAAQGRDLLKLSGAIPLDQGFAIKGKPVDIMIVDYAATGLVFNAKNSAGDGSTVRLSLAAKVDQTGAVISTGSAKYSLELKNLTLFEALKSAGFVNDNVKGLLAPVTFTFRFEKILFKGHKTFDYRARKDRMGTGK